MKTLLILPAMLTMFMVPVAQAQTLSLQDMESLSEDMIDYAVEQDTAKIQSALQTIDAALPDLFAVHTVDTTTQQNIRNIMQKMQTLSQSNDLNEFIVADNQLFSQLVDLLYTVDPSSTVPKAVIELDYLGRELQFQPKVKNWDKVQAAANSAQQKWQSLEPKVTDKGLRDLMNSTLEGLDAIVQDRNADELYYRGQLLLDEVDLLEGHFESQADQMIKKDPLQQTDNDADGDNDNDGDEGMEDRDNHDEQDEENDMEEIALGARVGAAGLFAGLGIGYLIWKRKK